MQQFCKNLNKHYTFSSIFVNPLFAKLKLQTYCSVVSIMQSFTADAVIL